MTKQPGKGAWTWDDEGAGWLGSNEPGRLVAALGAVLMYASKARVR